VLLYFSKILAGTYNVKVNYAGYPFKMIKDVLIAADKSTLLNLLMIPLYATN